MVEKCALDSPLLYALRQACKGSIATAVPPGIDSASALDSAAALDRDGIDVFVPASSHEIDPIAYVVRIADFSKGRGLLPTIVCDAADGRVRMFAYSNPQSVALALAEGKGVYWSRSRRAIWRKGESSGHVQRLIRAALDCDRDTMIFYVEQTGSTCHSGDARCFGDEPFSWNELTRRIGARAANGGPASYTKQLLSDERLLHGKILEEAAEVCAARSVHDVAWECADLLYFVSVKMRSANVSIGDVMAQLTARARA
ncbi:MAG TPA: phosphoribosyl-ATP diphosphatase [Candidatus Baltobacteraceae bacterium]|nr:phosphoribosyl-ATP diphosphatase [Candidatus Baltobacteraceae bacterium]